MHNTTDPEAPSRHHTPDRITQEDVPESSLSDALVVCKVVCPVLELLG